MRFLDEAKAFFLLRSRQTRVCAKPLQKWERLRMDYTQPGFWIAISVGGSLVGSLSAFQQYTNKEEEFRTRAVIRDFCIGAFLTAIIYMFIPDSIQSIITTVSTSTTNLATKVSSPDIELQVGPARF